MIINIVFYLGIVIGIVHLSRPAMVIIASVFPFQPILNIAYTWDSLILQPREHWIFSLISIMIIFVTVMFAVAGKKYGPRFKLSIVLNVVFVIVNQLLLLMQ